MITKSSLSIAEAIAVANNSDTPIQPKSLIMGLNEVSHSSVQYGDDFRKELLTVTGNNQEHTAILDVTSSKIAEAVRDSLDMVAVYGVPMAKALANGVSVVYNRKSLETLAYSLLDHKFINVDDPFFDSPIFPTEVKNKVLNFSAIDMSVLNKLAFDYSSDKDILEYANSDHPDIKEILNDTEYTLGAAFCLLTDLGELQSKFNQTGGVIDFTKVKCLDINLLMKAYVIITKMYVSEEPAPWVSKGSLENYREYVSLMWNGLSAYLINLKEIVSIYKARGITISEINPVGLAKHSVADYADANFLKGKSVIYFTDKALEAGISLSELVIAYYWAKVNGKSIDPNVLLGEASAVKELAEDYYSSIDKQLKLKARDVFISTANISVVKFIMERELLLERFKKLMPEGALIPQWLMEKLGDEYERTYYSVCEASDTNGIVNDKEPSPVFNGVMSSKLVPCFLRTMGCNMAASIVEATYVSGENQQTVQEQREALHEAIIKAVVSYSI